MVVDWADGFLVNSLVGVFLLGYRAFLPVVLVFFGLLCPERDLYRGHFNSISCALRRDFVVSLV